MGHKMLMWCNNVMKDKELQVELERYITALLEGPLKDKDEYAQEKCIKSFYEGLVYLESLLLQQNGIHPNDTNEIFAKIHKGSMSKEDFIRKTEEVRAKMKSEISRQFSNFLAFL